MDLLRHLPQTVSKQLRNSSLSNSIFKNSWVDRNYILFHYPPIILFERSWICPSTFPSINILSHLILSLVIKNLTSKVIWSALSTSYMESFLLFLLFIQNFLWALESLTIFQTDFLSIYLIKEKTIKSTSNNLITWFSSCPLPLPQPSL